jgi:hypothetical protein
LLDALVDGSAVGWCVLYARCGGETGDGVDEMLGESLYVPVGARCATVQIITAYRLGDMVQSSQCLFGTGEFVHHVSCSAGRDAERTAHAMCSPSSVSAAGS